MAIDPGSNWFDSEDDPVSERPRASIVSGVNTGVTVLTFVTILVGGILTLGRAQERLDQHGEDIRALKMEAERDRELLVRVDANTVAIKERLDRSAGRQTMISAYPADR